MIKLTFDIPPVAQARSRARHIPAKMVRTVTSMGIRTIRRKGKTYLYDPPAVKVYKAQLGMLARDQYKGKPLEGPLSVTIRFYRPNQKNISKKELKLREEGQIRPTKKPDLSNYVKSFEDALNGIVWKDDNSIIHEVTDKYYSLHSRIEVEVREWEPEKN